MSRALLRSPPAVRRATGADVPAIEALLAPEVSRGTVLPRRVVARDFLVIDGVRAAAALTPWTAEVVELGAVVVADRGRGLGRQLVEAACAEAARRGHRAVVALTDVPGFFQALGFEARDNPPWLPAGVATLRPAVPRAVAIKARTCAACPRLSTCRQRFMVRYVG